jgi:hypothetical protein
MYQIDPVTNQKQLFLIGIDIKNGNNVAKKEIQDPFINIEYLADSSSFKDYINEFL